HGVLIRGARPSNTLDFGHFGNWNIPPGLVAGNAHFLIDLNDQDGRGVMVAHVGDRPLGFISSRGPNGFRAISFSELDKVDRKIFAVELSALGAVTVVRAESMR